MNTEPRTAQEWSDWLAREEELTLRHAVEDLDQLLANGRQERQTETDYAGREILELLQNANDAAAAAKVPGRVRIALSTEGLLVANDGAPFTRAGVKSLRLANFSPKYGERETVGNKGLGFRAVLNWTRSPTVFSGGLSLIFSHAAALSRQQKIGVRGGEVIRRRIAAEQRRGGELVAPLLAFPVTADVAEDAGLLTSPAESTLYAEAIRLREAGWTTVIAMPFDRPETSLAAARAQLCYLQREILLFARSIAELEIEDVGRLSRHWRHETVSEEISRVHAGEGDVCDWRIFSHAGSVPPRFCPKDRPDGMHYEVMVAVPAVRPTGNGVLYSWFPTETLFPYPVVAHATLDLQANRQHPQDTQANHYILHRLAWKLAEVAGIVAHERGDDSGLELLSGGSGDDPLGKFHFRTKLRRLAQRLALVPTAGAGMLTAREARRTSFTDTAWLPREPFAKVACVRKERCTAALAWLSVRELGPLDWVQITNGLKFDSVVARADFVAGMVRHNVVAAMQSGGLLLNSEGQPVPRGHRVFIGANAQGTTGLPAWFQSHFLHDELQTALQARLGLTTQEQLIAKLEGFNAVRYSLASVIESLLAQARQRSKTEPAEEELTWRQVVGALYRLFLANGPVDRRPQFPRVNVPLRTLAGAVEDARKLYLSSEYGTRGRILEDLYGKFAREKLLAPPTDQGLVEPGEALAEYFVWLGVAEAPREVSAEQIEGGFLDHVREYLPSPLHIEDYSWPRGIDFDGHCSSATSLDGLKEILAHAPFAAVLAWLANESRAQNWKGVALNHGTLSAARAYAKVSRSYRAGIPSYIRWKLRTTPWLPTRDGRRMCPKDCLVESVPAITHLLPTPALPGADDLQTYGIGRGHLAQAWDNGGVLPGFSHLDAEQLYAFLLSLPERDPSGEAAKMVYEAVLRRFSDSDLLRSEGRKRWMEKGKIFARHEGRTSYVKVAEVWRLDAGDLPPALRRQIPVAEISKGVAGADKIETLLGVRSAKPGQIVRQICEAIPSTDAEAAASEVEELKPLIRFLRKTDRAKRTLERLKVKLCSAIIGSVEFAGRSVPLEPDVWEWVFDDATDCAFLLADPNEVEPLESPFFANAVGEIFAEVFDLARGAEFAQLAGCRCPRKRLALLRRMLGEESVPGLDELERRYREELNRERELIVPAAGLQPPTVARPTQPETLTPSISKPAEVTSGGPLQIQPVVHTPMPTSSVALRVTRTVQDGSGSMSVHERVSGDFCEAKVEEFEATSGRFPLRIGRITGFTAAGVDVLSFNTSEERETFLQTPRAALVGRFIEVKGRRDCGAKIDLRDNQLQAARDYGEKFYLYRVFDPGDGTFAFAMLQNPLHARDARKRYYQVDLDSAQGTVRAKLEGGLTKSAYLRGISTAAGGDGTATAGPSPAA